MSSAPQHTLWHTPDRSRLFLVPVDTVLPLGTLLVATGNGRTIAVEPAAIAPYEVSHAEARAWLDAQFSQKVTETRTAVMTQLRGWWDSLAPPTTMPAAPPPEYVAAAGLLARLTRRKSEELLADPAGVETALRKLADDAKAVVAAGASQDVERIVAARDLTRHFHAELKAAGVDLGDGFADAPLRLRRWFHQIDSERRLADAADRLCEWADRVEQAEPTIPEPIPTGESLVTEQPDRALLLARYTENSEQARHHESLRERTTSMVAQTSGVMIGLIGFKEGTWAGNPLGIVAAVFVIVLGVWGLSSAALSESRIRRHRERVSEIRKELDPEHVIPMPVHWTQWLWYVFHTCVVGLGVTLMVIVLKSR